MWVCVFFTEGEGEGEGEREAAAQLRLPRAMFKQYYYFRITRQPNDQFLTKESVSVLDSLLTSYMLGAYRPDMNHALSRA